MNKQRIAIDIDDVIADSTESVRLLANKKTGSNLTKDHYCIPGEYWGYYERVWKEHGLQDNVSFHNLGDDMATDQIHVPLLAGAEHGVSALLQNYEVVLMTSRDPDWEAATTKWVNHHFGDNVPELYFVKNHKDTNEKTKGELCVALDIDWLIDDNVEHCISADKVGVGAVLFGEYGWHEVKPRGLVHCKNWPSVIEFFDGKTV